MIRNAADLVYAPVGIAHLTGDNVDLLRSAALGRSRLRITTAAQINGKPHFGTVAAVLAVFALAEHASAVLDKPAEVVFDALDNAPAVTVPISGETYTRSVADLVRAGGLEHSERFDGFTRLLEYAADRAGVPYTVRPYAEYQRLAPVRECLHTIAGHLEEFRPIVAPADGVVRIRPRCPHCRLVEKSARSLKITAVPGGDVLLASKCPLHGKYIETITQAGAGWYDANTPVRSVLKGFLLAAERDLYDACTVSVDGADWGGAWHAHVLAPGLATLGVPPSNWPVSVFTPLIVDASGGKLSKTLYVQHGAYADLPELMLNLDVLLATDEGILDRVWDEVSGWVREPRRLHRSYSVEFLRRRLNLGAQAC